MEWKDRLLFAYDLQWFAKDGPGGEKTEPATEKKLREAREDGKVAKSKELTAAFDLIVLFLVLKVFISLIGNGFLNISIYTLCKNEVISFVDDSIALTLTKSGISLYT